MKKIKIQDLSPTLVQGVDVQLPKAVAPYREGNFEWFASSLQVQLQTNAVSGGFLKAWHQVPAFREVETHVDAEMFHFVSGVALMLFMDVPDGLPDIDSAQIVRIQPGTQIIISPGKGHFVPVAEGDAPVELIVVSPRMEAPRMTLPQVLEGE